MKAEILAGRSSKAAKVIAQMRADNEALRHEFRTGVMAPDSRVPWAAEAAKFSAIKRAAKATRREQEYSDDTYGGKRYF